MFGFDPSCDFAMRIRLGIHVLMLELSRSCDLELRAFVFGFDPHCDLALRVGARDPCSYARAEQKL